jgi:hypothetical protein
MARFTFDNMAEFNEVFDRAYKAKDFSDPRADAAFFYGMEGRPANDDEIVIGSLLVTTKKVGDRFQAVVEPLS